MGKQNKIFRARLPVSNIWNNRPLFVREKEMIAPGYYFRKYGMLGTISRQCNGVWVDATHRVVIRVRL